MKEKLKIVVAHPGKQHSYRLASALKKANLLDVYITTIYSKNSSLLMKITGKILTKNNAERLRKRKNEDLDDNEVIQYYQSRGLIETFLYRIDKSHKIYEIYRYRTACRFGKKVANYAIKHNVDAVVMFDTNANICFDILKKSAPNIKRILDVSIAARPYLKKIYEEDMSITNDKRLIRENYEIFGKNMISRSLKEIELSQHFIVASDFVSESLQSLGVNKNKIHKVPYGVNLNSDYSSQCVEGPLNFIFVGQVIARKGVHHLFEAFSKINPDKANLWVVGAVDIKSKEYKQYSKLKNIKFFGLVMHDELKSLYSRANVCIIPSLGEGMTLAGLEAMGCGLPIICTYNTGLNQAVIDKENGYYIPVSSVQAIIQAVDWFDENRRKIDILGKKAIEQAKLFTWKEYENSIVNEMRSICENE